MTIYDDPATFRGQLQRGRGAAVLRASREPGAGDAVYACVISDTRWDLQTEERDGYLAGLIRQLGLSPAPIERHLAAFEGDDTQDIELPLSVLALLQRAGHDDAAGVLRRYLAERRHGQYAQEMIELVEDAGTAPGRRTPAAGSEYRRRRLDEMAGIAKEELVRRLSPARTPPRTP